MKRILLASLAYLLITFPWAVIWHLVLFKPMYVELGYISENPRISLGFAAILIQGALLGFVYQRLREVYALAIGPWSFASLAFAYLWSSHVIAFAAKGHMQATMQFVAIESGYLALQFVFYAAALAFIYRRVGDPARG